MVNGLKEKVRQLPDLPGVYIFRDAHQKIIYIGKATSLKKRVSSYFSRDLSTKTQALVARIADLEYKTTPSESQALIVEAALIKEHQPQYNISLKDDKSFPFIKITKEDFPLVYVCRRKKKEDADTAVYFGPYTDAALLRQAIRIIRKIFPFRSCRKLPSGACLYGRIKLCPAPCAGAITKREYSRIIDNIVLFLKGKTDDLIKRLLVDMQEKSKNLLYEEAAQLRDQVNALTAVARGGSAGAGINELEDLRLMLALERPPRRVEGFDISNTSGQEACGSMVSFYEGRPDKSGYRRFRIKTVSVIDDYSMLAEVIRRRYQRLKEEKLPLPDLILVDGGKGHLAVAQKELLTLGLEVPLVSIAKEDENVYTNRKSHPIRFSIERPALNFIRRIRDEAHRFAVSYHQVLRRKKILGK